MNIFLERERTNLLRNERIEREQNFAINLLKTQEQTHELTERMPTLINKIKLEDFNKWILEITRVVTSTPNFKFSLLEFRTCTGYP